MAGTQLLRAAGAAGSAAWRRPAVSSLGWRALHTSATRRGLEEFFTGYNQDTVGRSWKPVELRLKSNEDLRKLWFVLVKERNMLLTYKAACHTRRVAMRNPHRLWKVQLTMSRIRTVIGLRMLRYKMRLNKNYLRKQLIKRAGRRHMRRAEARRRRWDERKQRLVWSQFKPGHPKFRHIAIKRMILLRSYLQARRQVAMGLRERMPRGLRARMRTYGLISRWEHAPQLWKKHQRPGFVPEFQLAQRRARVLRRLERLGEPRPTDEELEQMIRKPTISPSIAHLQHLTKPSQVKARQEVLTNWLTGELDASAPEAAAAGITPETTKTQVTVELRALTLRMRQLQAQALKRRRAARRANRRRLFSPATLTPKQARMLGIKNQQMQLPNELWPGHQAAARAVLGEDYTPKRAMRPKPAPTGRKAARLGLEEDVKAYVAANSDM